MSFTTHKTRFRNLFAYFFFLHLKPSSHRLLSMVQTNKKIYAKDPFAWFRKVWRFSFDGMRDSSGRNNNNNNKKNRATNLWYGFISAIFLGIHYMLIFLYGFTCFLMPFIVCFFSCFFFLFIFVFVFISFHISANHTPLFDWINCTLICVCMCL